MSNKIALFRLSVLGVLTSRLNLNHGEVKEIIESIAKQRLLIPNSNRTTVSARTIERWYARWKKNGLEGLTPKPRLDKGSSTLNDKLKTRILTLKKENMCRSVNSILTLLFDEGYGSLPRSSVHRFLKQHNLSQQVVSDTPSIERRQFEAYKASDIWYSDVMHGPCVTRKGKAVKTYLISYMDDASRLLTHSEFCFDEQAPSVEKVLKEAVMRRGLPKRLIVDNGPAYRSGSLAGICARLDIRLIFCRPYEPEGKGKLERWHRTVRAQFINELQDTHINNIEDLNDRLHAWVEEIYHQRKHDGLIDLSPLQRFRQDIPHTRRLGVLAKNIDRIFYHRIKRSVNKTATLQYNAQQYEVDYRYAKQTVYLVYDPFSKTPKFIEDKQGQYLCDVTPLAKHSNLTRERQRPESIRAEENKSTSLVENALERHQNKYKLKDKA